MSVDMYEHRFRQELLKLPKFEPGGQFDPRVWEKNVKFPAWRSIFTSLLLWKHSTGYKLPKFEAFFNACKKAYCVDHPDPERFRKYFEGEYLPGTRHRIGVWYESGMAETFLYACLVEAIEDKTKQGIVLYDTRIDFKMKADAVILINGCRIFVDSYTGDPKTRPAIHAQREAIEREQKINTSESAHWDNKEREDVINLAIWRNNNDCLLINGIRLFSWKSINQLLKEIYTISKAGNHYFFTSSDIKE